MTTVYIDRDNKINLRLEVDGSTVSSNTVTKVTLWIPGTVTTDGLPLTIDSSVDPQISLTEGSTVVELDLGSLSLKQGSARCYLSVFDAVNTDGIAWDTIDLTFRKWKPEL